MNHASEETHVPEVIKGLVKGDRICVLSTIAGDRPYSSLMRYTCNDECTEIYLVTHRNTTKYHNLRANPHVSLLIDTRITGTLQNIQALSIDGCYIPIQNDQKKMEMLSRFVACHPDLKTFANHPDAEVICIDIHSFLLLNGLQDARHIRIKS